MSDDKKKVELSTKPEGLPEDMIQFTEEGFPQRTFLRRGDQYSEVTSKAVQRVMRNSDREYHMYTPDAFVTCISKYGNATEGVIFYSQEQEGLVMYFNEAKRQEFVKINFVKSLEVTALLGQHGLGKDFVQKDFVDTVETFADCIQGGPELLALATHVKMDSTVNFESNIDPRNHVFMYSDKKGEQTARFPKKLALTIPFFEGSKIKTEVVVNLEIQMPKSADEYVVFTLSDPKGSRTAREAFQTEVDDLKKALKNWLFLAGRS